MLLCTLFACLHWSQYKMHLLLSHNQKKIESHLIKEMDLLIDKIDTYFQHPNPFLVYIKKI